MDLLLANFLNYLLADNVASSALVSCRFPSILFKKL